MQPYEGLHRASSSRTCCSNITACVLYAGLTLARQLHSSELNVVIIDGCACRSEVASKKCHVPTKCCYVVDVAGCPIGISIPVPDCAAFMPSGSLLTSCLMTSMLAASAGKVTTS